MPTYEKINLNIALRAKIALGISALVFFIIVLRLWYLQILKSDYFREQSDNNRISTVYIPPPRGLIFDRAMNLLVKNRPAFNVELVTDKASENEEIVSKISHVLSLRPAELFNRLKKSQKKRRVFEPRILLEDISRDTLARIAVQRYRLPGVFINVIPAREYIYGDLAAHLIGYIREITSTQLESPLYANYALGDLVGQYGIEAKWERYLQGKRGKQKVIVDATQTRRGELSTEAERPGLNLVLTIDLAVQRAADEALKGKKGAIVAMDPRSGEILAMSSSPRYDPNVFTREIPTELWQDLRMGKDKKLNNRVVQGIYPPGSVFKIFMAVAGLSEGVIKPNEEINCPGHYTLGRTFKCHKASGHGLVNLKSALIQSCDVYFYTVGQRLGIDRINEYATRFGLGKLTGLDLFREGKGLIPSTEWKQKNFSREEDKKWYPGETPSVAIGQGAVAVTPLQVARGLSALVNGQELLRPYAVKAMYSNDGMLRDENFTKEVDSHLDIDPKVINLVRDALVGVVNDERGTGHRAKLADEYKVVVAGKTGTAQVGSLDLQHLAQHFEDHAWFAGYAPADRPEIVVVALVENGGHGGVTAAPLVRQVMEAYFGPLPRQDISSVAAIATPLRQNPKVTNAN